MFDMLKGPEPDPEPPMPEDKTLRSLAEQFRIPRALSKNFLIISLVLDLQAKSRPETSLVAIVAAGAKPWFLTMFLMSAVLDHCARSAKLDNLHHPEVKLFNLGVVLSALLLGISSAAAAAVQAGAVAPGATGLASTAVATLAACPQVPLTALVVFALPAVRSLLMTGVSGVLPLVEQVLSDLKTEFVGSPDKNQEPEDERAANSNHRMLATAYGVLCVEAFLSAFSRPASLPFLRCAVMAVLAKNAFDANPKVLSSYKFRTLNDGLLTSSIGMFTLANSGRLVPMACVAAAMVGSQVAKDAAAGRGSTPVENADAPLPGTALPAV